MISTAATQSAGSWRALCPACADGCVCVRVSLLTKVAHQHGEDCALLRELVRRMWTQYDRKACPASSHRASLSAHRRGYHHLARGALHRIARLSEIRVDILGDDPL